MPSEQRVYPEAQLKAAGRSSRHYGHLRWCEVPAVDVDMAGADIAFLLHSY